MYQAWTGSHRIAAAREADLRTIPGYAVSEELLPESVTANWDHVTDSERVKIMREVGDQIAIQLMVVEGRLI